MRKLLLASILASLLNLSPAQAATLSGHVVRVPDGDTITVVDNSNRKHRVRFLGIDAPEKNQAEGMACGRNLYDKIYGETVQVHYGKKDQYGRILGTVFFGDRNINLEQVSEGCAWYYRHYARDVPRTLRRAYSDAESEAQSNRLGLWSRPNPIPPWEFRKQQRNR